MISLDLSAEFDTVDHGIFLSILFQIGIIGQAHSLIKSYLNGQTQFVLIDGRYSEDKSIEAGVPQGSILGSVLFILYLLPLRSLLKEFLASYHIYADDITVYLDFDLGITFANFLKHKKINASVLILLAGLKLKGNSSKTQCMFVTNQRFRFPETITIDRIRIEIKNSVKVLGVILDNKLCFSSFINSTGAKSYYHLRRITSIRKYLSFDLTKFLILTFVISRLDYCNSLVVWCSGLHDFPENFVKLVENIYQNTTAHMKVNGYLTSKLKMTRGVRQGCPLSALLFIIALEALIERLRSHNWFTHDTERRAVAYADDINIFVHAEDLETLFERLKIFSEGTQFEVNQDKSTVLKRTSTSTQRVSSRAKVLGVHLSFNEESEYENKSKVRKILEDGGKIFNKYLSLYARALIMKTFFLPKLLHNLRHMKLDMKIIQDFKVFSKQALWGSKKSLVALEFLERSVKEGRIGWPSLMFEIMACKTLDLVGILASTDVASKNLLLELWNRNIKYKNELRNEFRQVNISIMDKLSKKVD